MKKSSKKQKQKAGDSTKGYFEAGEVVTTKQETKPKILVTSTMLPRSNPKSYWNTPAGKKRIAEMQKIMKKNKGKLVKGVRSTEANQKDAKTKIQAKKKQLKALGE